MIEYAVQDDLHPALMGFLHKGDEYLIGGLQILLIRYTRDISGRLGIVQGIRRKKISGILHDLSEMRIHIIIVLYIIFMIGGGYEDGVQINGIHAQILQVIQLVDNALQISSVEVPHIHVLGVPVPVPDMLDRLSDIAVLVRKHII